MIISFDSILKNNLGLMVSCRKFRLFSILWMLRLVGHCGGCWIGVVLPPFGQTGLRPFIASYVNIHIAGHIQFLVILGVISLSVFGVLR